MQRGEIWWAALPDPIGASPGFRRPVLIVQASAFTQSQIATVIVATITSNLRLASAPGNVLLPAAESGLAKDSVVNVSQIVTIDKGLLDERVGRLSAQLARRVDAGLRLALEL
jgi:mRNA interferase MazF